MAQFARPDSDITNAGSWATTPLFDKIDEVVADDATTEVTSQSDPGVTDTFVVGLSSVTDPASSSGHTMRVRVRRTGGAAGDDFDNIQLRLAYVSEVSLGTLIAELTNIGDTTSYTDFAHTLSGAEADAITDYADLSIRFVPNMPSGNNNPTGKVTWAELEVPDAAVGGGWVYQRDQHPVPGSLGFGVN